MYSESDPDYSDQSVSDHQFPVVGIGASAGGLEAFKLFLQAIPQKSGMAYVYVQHLSADHESNLTEILQKVTNLQVYLISDNIHLQPDHLYILPPGKMLIATDGILKLEPIGNKKIRVIDLFFSSLGIVHQSYAVGVVLSGALTDGTLGLQVIKSYGGLTFAQNEASAAFDSMPKSAIKSGAVDFILPADQIIVKLITINHPFHTNYTESEIKQNEPQQDEDVFRQLLAVLRSHSGVDFTNYKQSTIKRRIIRRMALNKFNKPNDYLAFLNENKAEQDALYNDMLISVTNFFRAPQSFDLLCKDIFPRLLNQKTAHEPIRIWVAGCATGEEAYSIAICLQVFADEDRIEQVVVNLVNNAVKYAPDCKNIYLIVKKENNMAKVSVKDGGPGIPKEKLPLLFDRYYRTDYSGGQYSGLGLGLYISSEVIKRHGGKIGVESEVNQGSTFWFTLPL
jgi:two-component system CheB/CheR fusion protein